MNPTHRLDAGSAYVAISSFDRPVLNIAASRASLAPVLSRWCANVRSLLLCWSAAIVLPASGEAQVMVVRPFTEQLTGIQVMNPNVKLSVARDPARGQLVLSVEYPAPSGPASRDVWSDAEHRDWSNGRAIAFDAKPDQAIRLSVSFRDRNGVAYTSWADLDADEWQHIEIPFAEIKPNPYFQPPDAKTGAPLDVSEVMRIGFAPQSREGGRLAISEFAIID